MPPTEPPGRRRADRLKPVLAALAHRDFRIFAVGNFASHVGTWIQRVAVAWLTWELTHSPAWLGIVAFAELFPTVVLAPITGAVADRVDRLAATRAVQSVNLLQAALMAAITLAGAMTVEILVVLVAFGGVSVSFGQPVRLAIVPSLVPYKDLSAAIGVNAMSFNGARFIGPMIAGPAIVWFGAGYAFVVNAASFAVFLLALWTIRLARAGPPAGKREVRGIPREIAEGYRYAVGHPGIAPILAVLTVVSLFARPYMELLPAFADTVFDRGAAGLAWLTSMAGLGALAGAAWLAQRGAVAGLTAAAIGAIAVLSGALTVFAATGVFWLALAALTVVGFATIVVGVGEQTLIQNAVAPELRGRVMGLYGMIARGAPALGALGMGAVSSHTGVQWPVIAGAVVCVGAWLWARRRRQDIAAALETPGR